MEIGKSQVNAVAVLTMFVSLWRCHSDLREEYDWPRCLLYNQAEPTLRSLALFGMTFWQAR